MKINKKEEYAVKMMVYLAMVKIYRDRPTMGQELGISPHNAKKILISLKRAGLVESIRGRNGGYELAAAPENIRLIEIFRAVEERSSESRGSRQEQQEERRSPLAKSVSSIYYIMQNKMEQPMQMTLQDFMNLAG